MGDRYYVDLTEISLAAYAEDLAQLELTKARRPLQDKLPARFAALEDAGIGNLDELLSAISTAKRRQTLADETGVPVEYLVLLRRQVNGFRPKPVSLGSFPEVNPDTVEWLATQGIRQSRQLLARAACLEDCQSMAGSPQQAAELWELVRMSDLSRVNGVGPIFARMMLAVGVDTVARLAQASAAPLYDQLSELNDRHRYSRSWFSLAEMQTCINIARTLPIIIQSS